MSDIHGCFDELNMMLKKINFTKSDKLILAGDYIDRGTQNKQMLDWLSKRPQNVVFLKGNHDVEFSQYVDLMQETLDKSGGAYDINSVAHTLKLYTMTLVKYNGIDYYGSMKKMIMKDNATMSDFLKWKSEIDRLDYVYKDQINGRTCVVVHAGYAESLEAIKNLNTKFIYSSIEEFYIYARTDAYLFGGLPHGMVIAGHTPTIASREFSYNKGKVYRLYDKNKDCIFYDIDCGCSMRHIWTEGQLACIRLEDEKVFYIK
jgi:serine/threonine protein phosphatase 1